MAPDQADAVRPKGCPFAVAGGERLPTIEEALGDSALTPNSDNAHALEVYRKANEACCMFRNRGSPRLPIPNASGSQSGSARPAGCPFTSLEDRMSRISKSRTQSQVAHDPVEVRSQLKSQIRSYQAKKPITPAESTASGPVCPIRFMDKHSPEEIAEYFEEHKHELPRSHEVCVKRFQSNADSIAKLDEKYGNLVAMINGLGKYHKPMMPENPEAEEGEEEEAVDDPKRDAKIEAWSKAVSHSSEGAEKEEDFASREVDMNEVEAEGRLGHFERPLKEIRVGESPSRPWGVPIPSKYLDREDDAQSISSAPKKVDDALQVKAESPEGRKDQEAKNTDRPKGKCPFDRKAMAAMAAAAPAKGGAPGAETMHAAMDRKVIIQPPQFQTKEADKNEAPAPQGQTNADAGVDANIINHGVAIVASSQTRKVSKLINYGTLFLADSAQHAEAVLDRVLEKSNSKSP